MKYFNLNTNRVKTHRKSHRYLWCNVQKPHSAFVKITINCFIIVIIHINKRFQFFFLNLFRIITLLHCQASRTNKNVFSLFVAGKMFKSAELPWLITFFQMFYNDKPVDWLLEHLIYTKVCNWEKDMVRCTNY